jgi:hypothetical protein
MAIVAKETRKVTWECSEHPNERALQTEYCPSCDKCEHGTTRNGYCVKCVEKFGTDWITAPLTEQEIRYLERLFENASLEAYRTSPYPRTYTAVSLTKKLIQEFKQYKAATA